MEEVEGKVEGMREGRRSLPPSEPEDRNDIVVGECSFWRDETFGTKPFRLGIDFWVV